MDALLTAGVTPPMARLAWAWLSDVAVEPGLGTIRLAPHQIEAVARLRDLVRDYGGAVLADETGMGKTYAALGLARDWGRCLVVAPAALRNTWEQALARAGIRGSVVSFERLSRAGRAEQRRRARRDRLSAQRGATLVVIDEAHHVRNPRTRRYEALARLVWGFPVLLLTATPVHNLLRDLRSQLALFLGAAASSLGEADLARLVVRRRHDVLHHAQRLPAVEPVHWLGVDPAPEVLASIVELPPAVPPADGGTAHALLRLGLLRAWSSSGAALRAALRHRLQRAAALGNALDAGRFPTAAELRAWSIVDDAVQLAFPELAAGAAPPNDAAALRAAITAHVDGVHRIRAALEAATDPDHHRAEHLRALMRRHAGTPIVAFTHFAETAIGLGRRLTGDPGVAVVTARGGRIASGRIARREIIARLSPHAPQRDEARFPLRLVLATDVLSEGLDLQQAGVLVHLDLPWTVARLEQRLGRLRRIGSPHVRLHTYAIGPPVHARELVTTVRALQRKARLVRSMVGTPEVAVHQPLLGARLRGSTMEPEIDLATATEELRRILESWSAPTPPDSSIDSTVCPSMPASVAGVHGGPLSRSGEADQVVPCDTRCATPLDVPWCAIVLVRTGSRHRLLAIELGEVSEDPRRVLACLRRWCAATPIQSARERDEADVLAEVQRALDQWLAERRADALTALALDAPSAAHVRTLRWLDALLARAPRHQRFATAGAVARCRDLVLRARGAGAELFLAEWLAMASRDDAVSPVDHLATLSSTLAACSVGRGDAPATDTALAAVLVLCPAD